MIHLNDFRGNIDYEMKAIMYKNESSENRNIKKTNLIGLKLAKAECRYLGFRYTKTAKPFEHK